MTEVELTQELLHILEDEPVGPDDDGEPMAMDDVAMTIDDDHESNVVEQTIWYMDAIDVLEAALVNTTRALATLSQQDSKFTIVLRDDMEVQILASTILKTTFLNQPQLNRDRTTTRRLIWQRCWRS